MYITKGMHLQYPVKDSSQCRMWAKVWAADILQGWMAMMIFNLPLWGKDIVDRTTSVQHRQNSLESVAHLWMQWWQGIFRERNIKAHLRLSLKAVRLIV